MTVSLCSDRSCFVTQTAAQYSSKTPGGGGEEEQGGEWGRRLGVVLGDHHLHSADTANPRSAL